MLPSNTPSPSPLCLNINYSQSKRPVTSAAWGAPQAGVDRVMEQTFSPHFTAWKYRETTQKNAAFKNTVIILKNSKANWPGCSASIFSWENKLHSFNIQNFLILVPNAFLWINIGGMKRLSSLLQHSLPG